MREVNGVEKIKSNGPHVTREEKVNSLTKRAILLRNGNPQGNPNDAPRCLAKTRKAKGKLCRAPAMPNGRCRLHGGKSTGPRTPEGLERSRKANWKHGYYSANSPARYADRVLRECREMRRLIRLELNLKLTDLGATR
jgi:hypothetical protein